MRSHTAIPQRNSVNVVKNRAGSAFIRKLTTFLDGVRAVTTARGSLTPIVSAEINYCYVGVSMREKTLERRGRNKVY